MKKKRSFAESAMRYRAIVFLICAVLVAYGIYGLLEIRKNEFPSFTVRQGVVVAVYPGANVNEVENRVTKPLKDFIFTYGEVEKKKTTSTTRDGLDIVQVLLNEDLNDKDTFWSKFKHGVQNFKSSLPAGVLAIVVMDDFGDASAILLTLESENKTYPEMSEYLDRLADRLRTLESVGRINRFGELKSQISIYLDNDKLAQYGLGFKSTAMMLMGLDPAMLAGLPTGYSLRMLDKGIVGHLTLVQPIFAGGQIYNGNQLAKIGTRAAKLQETLAETEIRKNTETYYWLIVSLKEKLKTIDEAQKQVEAIRKDVEAAVDAGVAVKNDLLRVELEKKKLESNRVKVENGIAVAKLMLARQMNRDNSDFELAEASLDNINPPDDYKMSANEAVERRAESKLLAIGREVTEKERSMERGKVLPTVAVGASLLYQNLLDDDAVNGVLFATVTVPISDWWSNSYSTAKFDLKAQKAAIDEAENKNLIKVDIEAKWNSLNESYKHIEISRDAVAQAEENLRIQRDFYNAGTATLSKLLEAETLRQQAADSYSDAVTGYYTAVCAYLTATGR